MTIPQRTGAKSRQSGDTKTERHVRYETLRSIRQVGLPEWKRKSNNYRHSPAETMVFRDKTIFGNWLRTRKLKTKPLCTGCAEVEESTHSWELKVSLKNESTS